MTEQQITDIISLANKSVDAVTKGNKWLYIIITVMTISFYLTAFSISYLYFRTSYPYPTISAETQSQTQSSSSKSEMNINKK